METPAKCFTCQYCGREFRRREHAQRHERTHTKETPFKCFCGKAFSRGDLLRRHEKLSHDQSSQILGDTRPVDGVNGPQQPLNSTVTSQQEENIIRAPRPGTRRQTPNESTTIDPYLEGRTNIQLWGDDLGLQLSDSSGLHTASTSGPVEMAITTTTLDSTGVSDQYDPFSSTLGNLDADSVDSNSIGFGEFDVFLDNADLSFLIPQVFDDTNINFLPLQNTDSQSFETAWPRNGNERRMSEPQNSEKENQSTCRQGQPDGQQRIRTTGSTASRQPCWKMSTVGYRHMVKRLRPFSKVMPQEFVPLSRHTMSRFIEGCIKGFCEHFPFLHISTFSVESAAPELLLSMAAIGAQFRFESHRKLMLFDAGKAVISERLRLWETHKDRDDSCTTQMLQALLCLLAVALWGPEKLLQESTDLQSMVVRLMRMATRYRSELTTESSEDDYEYRWLSWVQKEMLKRTRFVAYSLLTLVSLAYQTSPPLLTSEIHESLPSSNKTWSAKTSQRWTELESSAEFLGTNFQSSLESLFQRNLALNTHAELSPFAHYVLIVAILQHIFLRRETLLRSHRHSIHPADTEEISRALQYWQASWERSREVDKDDQAGNNPVIFNATALLRLAWLRLHADLGPCRSLTSRDPALIATAFSNCPSIPRGPNIMQPALQAVHALSVPVRMGVSFVARTQTISWSVQLSLSNLECAIFLCKWLERLVSTCKDSPLEVQELKLVAVIHGLLQETGMFEDGIIQNITDRQDQNHKLRVLAMGVVKLWAEVFKGMHVFELVDTIGTSLAIYAEMMERACSPESSE